MKKCENCNGTGYIVAGTEMCGEHVTRRCHVCKGRGVVFDEDSTVPKDFAGVDLSKGESFTRTRMSRRAKMRAMADEQLAEYLVENAEELSAPDGDYHKHAERFALGWLQQEVEE